MGTATITIEDSENGALEFGLRLDSEFDVKSGAHQVANIILNHLDEIMERKQDGREAG